MRAWCLRDAFGTGGGSLLDQGRGNPVPQESGSRLQNISAVGRVEGLRPGRESGATRVCTRVSARHISSASSHRTCRRVLFFGNRHHAAGARFPRIPAARLPLLPRGAEPALRRPPGT